jgi:hypothetical protein
MQTQTMRLPRFDVILSIAFVVFVSVIVGLFLTHLFIRQRLVPEADDPLLTMDCRAQPDAAAGPHQAPPEAGQYWILEDYARAPTDPWGQRHSLGPVHILDVREGWVRYALTRLTKRHERISVFINSYIPCTPP